MLNEQDHSPLLLYPYDVVTVDNVGIQLVSDGTGYAVAFSLYLAGSDSPVLINTTIYEDCQACALDRAEECAWNLGENVLDEVLVFDKTGTIIDEYDLESDPHEHSETD